jgi:hypothetical protein
VREFTARLADCEMLEILLQMLLFSTLGVLQKAFRLSESLIGVLVDTFSHLERVEMESLFGSTSSQTNREIVFTSFSF